MKGCNPSRFPFSIGSNTFEGSVSRLARQHLAAIRVSGAEFYELHLGYRFASDNGQQPWRVATCFVDLGDQESLGAIASWQHELGLRAGQMHAPAAGEDFDYAAQDETSRHCASELLAAAAQAAEQLEIPFVVVHPHLPDGTQYSCGKSAILAQLRRTIEERLDDFRQAHSAIALENLPLVWAPCGVDLLDLVEICEGFNSPTLGICLDTGHARLDGWKPAGAVRACGQWLRCLHLHDNFGTSDDHLLPFDGEADWSGFVPALRQVGYRGTLNLEVKYEPYQTGADAAQNYRSRRGLIKEAIRRVEALRAL